jgi:hypothetical protein
MALNLKNYTSEVPAVTSMGKIERCLVEAGATDISKKYRDGVCESIVFRMMVNNIPLFFQLPAKVDACFKVLWKEVKRPQPDTKQRILSQSERTAWKIVCDWVEIQLSMIRLEQAEVMQVFLPYVYDPVTDQTFYNKLKESNFKQLTYKG